MQGTLVTLFTQCYLGPFTSQLKKIPSLYQVEVERFMVSDHVQLGHFNGDWLLSLIHI